ncbi:MAG: homoserine kinase [Flavobacteriaceae bacterium]|nr:homoserine kinase [Flavobacteriaceae bacterium]
MDRLKILSPATVANVACGFDAMAFALDGLGDEMIFQKNESGEVTISKIAGADLPLEPHLNVAGAVAQKMLKDLGSDIGIDIQIFKNYKPGSGLGSSAASSAGAAFGVNEITGRPFSKTELMNYAMYGEELACGAPIADNVAAVLYGGFVLIRDYTPLDIVSIPTPKNLFVAIIHPQIEVKTEEAREVLPKSINLDIAISQWANVGGLISGLYSSNYSLIGRSLVDLVTEPHRKKFIPHFDEIKQTAIANGALGAGISGSGPSVFALCEGQNNAQNVANALNELYKTKEIDYKIYTSGISSRGVRILDK